MTAETELPEIPAEEIARRPVTQMTVRSPIAQAVQAQIAQEVSTKPAEPETTNQVKRGPGRPPGSKNKTTTERPSAPSTAKAPPAQKPSEAQKIAAKAIDDEKSGKRDKASPPDFTEWQDFIGEIVLHWFSVAFIAVAFRGIPYHEIMSEKDYEDIQLDDEELAAVARPFAHLATHSGLNTKYGRAIMNSRDSIEATVVLFMWGSRVRRISKNYRVQWEQYQEREMQNVARIPRPDRARDTSAEIEAESIQPIVGLAHSAFGHGFN